MIDGIKRTVFLLVLVLSIFRFSLSFADYDPVIYDEADLLTDEHETILLEAMKPIGKYCVPVFLSIEKASSADMENKIKPYLTALPGDDAVFFIIDMAERRIEIYSTARIYQVITTSVANKITNDVYRMATDGDYLGCARAAFEEINDILSSTEKASPTEKVFSTEKPVIQTDDSGILSNILLWFVQALRLLYVFTH